MIQQNLHTHTTFDDGKNTIPEMAQAALDAGLTSLGFSGHSPLPWDNDWAMTAPGESAYRAAVEEVRQAFAGRLTVYCGLEWDSLSPPAAAGYDYLIGSVHHLAGLAFPPPSVDESPEATRAALRQYFNGDAAAYAEEYFSRVAALADTPAEIVGHFDLLTKYDEKASIFDENAPRYRDAAMAAMEPLLRADKLFEVNTGAISRGWRTSPYPSRRLLRELRARKARVLVTSDAHSADAVACAFPETVELLRFLGFRERWELTEHGFQPVKL